jgi:hypothetical protein
MILFTVRRPRVGVHLLRAMHTKALQCKMVCVMMLNELARQARSACLDVCFGEVSSEYLCVYVFVSRCAGVLAGDHNT